MAAINGIYYTWPNDGRPVSVGAVGIGTEAGLWIDLATGPNRGLIGLPARLWPAIPGGNPNTKKRRFEEQLDSLYKTYFEVKTPLAEIFEPELSTPEPGCRIEGQWYICALCSITVTVLSLDPLAIDSVIVGEGSSASTVYL